MTSCAVSGSLARAIMMAPRTQLSDERGDERSHRLMIQERFMHRPDQKNLAVILGLAGAVMGTAAPASAAYQTCGESFVAIDMVRCPDGSVPHYNVGDPPQAAGNTARSPVGTPASRNMETQLFGIWHTNRSGAALSSALDVPGAYLLNSKIGLAQGDLTISPNGSYVWNTFTGTSGRWVRGEKDGIVLYDETQRRRWRVTLAGERVLITSDPESFTGRR
eukprot:gene1504-1526_t